MSAKDSWSPSTAVPAHTIALKRTHHSKSILAPLLSSEQMKDNKVPAGSGSNTLPWCFLHILFTNTSVDYWYKVVMLQSTALVESSCINRFLFYKQDSQKCVTESVKHAQASWYPDPQTNPEMKPPQGAWPAKLNFLHLLSHPTKLSYKS